MSKFSANIFSIATTYFELLMVLSYLQKSEFLKLIILFFHNFWRQNWDEWHKLREKNTHMYFFSTFCSKLTSLSEIIGNKWKNSKNLKVAGTLVFQIFQMKNQTNQLIKKKNQLLLLQFLQSMVRQVRQLSYPNIQIC